MQSRIRQGLAAFRAVTRNWAGRKFEPEAPYLPLLVEPSSRCLHIGATDGRHAYMMAKGLDRAQGGHIWAYEPSPITFPVLRATTRIHGLGRLLTPVQQAVYDKECTLVLNVPVKRSGRIGNAFGFISENPASRRPEVESRGMRHFTVSATTIDSIVETRMGGRFDLLRMDIEGAEALALAGGWRSIEDQLPHIVIEIHPRLLGPERGGTPRDLYERFRALGYRPFLLDEAGHPVPAEDFDVLPWKDYFLISPARRHRMPLEA